MGAARNWYIQTYIFMGLGALFPTADLSRFKTGANSVLFWYNARVPCLMLSFCAVAVF